MSESETDCWRCKEQITASAEKCPYCGVYRLSKTDTIAGWATAGFITFILSLFVFVFSPFFGSIFAFASILFPVWIARRKLKLGHYRTAM